MHIIHYTKHFLTGNLAGMAVKCTISAPNADHAQNYLALLETYTEQNPGSDYVTDSQFWVSFT